MRFTNRATARLPAASTIQKSWSRLTLNERTGASTTRTRMLARRVIVLPATSETVITNGSRWTRSSCTEADMTWRTVDRSPFASRRTV